MKTLSTLFLLAWSLWFGGEMTLFLCVIALFRHDHALGVQAAPQLFLMFERYQIIVALVAVATASCLLLITRRKVYLWSTALLWTAAVGAFFSVSIVTPRIMQLREANQIDTPEFKTLHTRATCVYDTEFLLLLTAGLLMPHALRHPAALQTTKEFAPAPAPLA